MIHIKGFATQHKLSVHELVTIIITRKKKISCFPLRNHTDARHWNHVYSLYVKPSELSSCPYHITLYLYFHQHALMSESIVLVFCCSK